MRLTFKPQEGFYGELFMNLFLTIITLGLYLPWAVTNVRRIVWSNVSLENSRFHYLGNAEELVKGYLILIGLYVVSKILGSLTVAVDPTSLLIIILAIPGSVVFFALLYKMQLGSFRYQVHRTAYKGIRFYTDLGSVKEQYMDCLRMGFYTAITFGLLYVYFFYKVEIKKLNSLRFGEEKFSFDLSFRDYSKIFTVPLVTGICSALFMGGMISTLGRQPGVMVAILMIPAVIMTIAMMYATYKLFLTKVRFLKSQHLSFETDLDFSDYLKTNLLNIPILLLTFGLGMPLVLARNIGLYANSLVVLGLNNFTTSADPNVPQVGLDDLVAHNYDLDIIDVF